MTVEPIVHVLSLRCDPAAAFDAYARIGEWWHPDYTSDARTLATVLIEPRLGGRVFERHRDGDEVDWGRVTAWEPPHRLGYATFLAQPRETPSEIKFREWPLLLRRFAALADH